MTCEIKFSCHPRRKSLPHDCIRIPKYFGRGDTLEKQRKRNEDRFVNELFARIAKKIKISQFEWDKLGEVIGNRFH